MNIKKIVRDSPLYLLAIAALIIICLLADDPGRKLYWDGDYSIYLVDMFDASRFKQTLGIASRFGWSHPGPLNYYVLLPAFWFSKGGDQSVVFGTALFNFILLFFSARLIARLTSRAVSILFLIMLTAYMASALGTRVFFDVLLPFSTIFPWVLAVCLACAVALRGWRYSIVLAMVLAYVTQAHVAFWIPSVVLAISAVLLSLSMRRPDKKDAICLLLAALVFFLLWLPPLIELKNLKLIFSFFMTQPAGQHTLADAFRALAVLVGEPLVGKTLWYTNTPVENTAFLIGAITLALVPILTWLGYRRKNHFALILGGLMVFQILAYLVSLTKVVGPILHHSVTFFPVIAIFIFVQLFSLICKDAPPKLALTVDTVNVIAVLGLLAFFSKNMLVALETVKTPDQVMQSVSEKLNSELHQCTGPATIKINQASWNFGIGAASYAYRGGAKFAISPRDWAIVFGGRVPLTSEDCHLDFTWQDGKVGIARTDYGDKTRYDVKQWVTLPNLTLITFGTATFGKHSVSSATLADASLVSNEVILPPGIYKADITLSYDVTSEVAGANGAHISLHGNKMLLPILTGKQTDQHVTFYFDMDGQPTRFSFGLGGWTRGKGYIELKEFNISSIKKRVP